MCACVVARRGDGREADTQSVSAHLLRSTDLCTGSKYTVGPGLGRLVELMAEDEVVSFSVSKVTDQEYRKQC